MAGKTPSTDTLLWLDYEFTGLAIDDDLVIEAGAVVTDYSLKTLATFQSFIHYPSKLVAPLIDRNPWWQERQQHREAMLGHVAAAPHGLEDVGTRLAQFASEWCSEPVVLAGNSIHNDRKWVERDFPRLNEVLHYRMLDVSALKLVAHGMFGIVFDKKESHRAVEDLAESIEELRFLLLALGKVNMSHLIP